MKDGLLDRVTRLEAFQAEVVKTIQAISRVVGPSEVQAELALAARAEQEKAVADLVKAGKLRPSETAGANSFVVGAERSPDGTAAFPGRFQVALRDLSEESRALFMGRKAKDEVPLPNGNTIQVFEVYDIIEGEPEPEPKAKKAPKAKRPKAQTPATKSPDTVN